MARLLPGVYDSLQDLSNLPEGQTSLTVGVVLKADKGPVNEATLITSPSDLLNTYVFGGVPSIKADPTLWSLLKILAKTNQVYVSRAANNPLYGGIVFKRTRELGYLVSTNAEDKSVVIQGEANLKEGDTFILPNVGMLTVASTEASGANTKVTVKEDTLTTGVYSYVITKTEGNSITVTGDLTQVALTGKVAIDGSTVAENNKVYSVVKVSAGSTGGTSVVEVSESLKAATDGTLYTNANKVVTAPMAPLAAPIANPDSYEFGTDDLFLVTGSSQGEWNGKLSFEIESSLDDTSMLYRQGNKISDDTVCWFDTVNMTVRDTDTNEVLGNYLFSRDVTAKTVDGISLYIDNVISNDVNIKVVNNDENATDLPSSSDGVKVQACAGTNGGAISPEVMVAALQPFTNKNINISILANGCSDEAESEIFQKALLETVENRKDCFLFLNNQKTAEQAQLPSARAANIVDYKKNTLSSVSFYGAMYCPHGKTTDIYNSRQVRIGSAEVAIAGWLDVINNLNYPNAYAGPRNGLVNGMTYDWKIGDNSGEAVTLNDASVNYVAFDALVGRYYMQCQNTLQMANSSLRNIGAVLNILDIKEHLITLLKEYIQLPITDSLRSQIVSTCVNYLDPMNGSRFTNYTFQDMSRDVDIADNTLRYLLTIAPTPYAQKIYLMMNIVNATYDFAIAQSL